MKPQFFAAVAGFLLVVALVLIVTGKPQHSAPAVDTSADQLVTVIGDGEVRVKPDQAIISFGILSHGDSAAEAESLLVASAARVHTAFAQAAGVDEEQVELSRQELQADNHADFVGAVRIAGYSAHMRVTATTRSVGKVQAIIDATLAAGATSVESVSYAATGLESARQAALVKALDNARVRAGALTHSDGQSVGALKSSEALPDEASPQPSPTAVTVRARVKATFAY